jgi:AraC-like DNA-binding protein
MPRGWSLPSRTLAWHDIIRVRAGRGVFSYGERRQLVRAPAWVLLPAQVPHAINGDRLELTVVHVLAGAGERLDALKLFHPEAELTPALPAGLEELFERAVDAWRERTPLGRVCANRWMELWFTRAFGERLPAAGGWDRRLVEALAWLHRHADRSLRLDELARAVGLSGAHLRSLFRSHFNASPKQVLQDIRMHHAQTRLAAGSGVAEAAYASGWEDVSAFAKAFRRRLGLSPSEYRRQLAAGVFP